MLKKAKLNYMPVTQKRPPKDRIPVSRNRLEALDQSIRQKIIQNEKELIASRDIADRYMVQKG